MASQAYGAAASAATSLIVSRMLGGGVLSANEPQTVQKEDETDPEFELIENDELDNEDV